MKRLLDITLVVLSAVITLPLAVFVAAAVATTLGRPLLFRQKRIGLGGEPFELLKFRTMREPASEFSREESDEARLTRLGRVLREFSLDEIPQLLNVLRGKMSLVGPRPLLPEYLTLYSEREKRRHEVRPGITGWAQIGGRNRLSWPEKLERDVWYVEHHSIWLDLKILIRSVAVILSRQGISTDGHATAPPFTGSTTPDLEAQDAPE